MISQLCCLSSLVNALIPIGIIVGMVIVVVAMIKYPHAKPYFLGFICLVMIFSGAYSAFTAWDYYNTHSSVVGELEEHDPYEDFNYYEYDLEKFGLVRDAVADEEGNVTYSNFYYKISYPKNLSFNGTENKYVLLLNDKPCYQTKSSFGKLFGTTEIHFDDVDGQLLTSIEMQVAFTFYSSSINIRIDTNATVENATMLEEYFKIYGFNLRIIEEVITNEPILTDKAS